MRFEFLQFKATVTSTVGLWTTVSSSVVVKTTSTETKTQPDQRSKHDKIKSRPRPDQYYSHTA